MLGYLVITPGYPMISISSGCVEAVTRIDSPKLMRQDFKDFDVLPVQLVRDSVPGAMKLEYVDRKSHPVLSCFPPSWQKALAKNCKRN
jgi:hypothetical protein